MISRLYDRSARICVVGLGYVGLPLALELAKTFDVVGFDVNPDKVDQVQAEHPELHTSAQDGILADASCYIVAVPTPIDQNNLPDLESIRQATLKIGGHLKQGDYVIYESTVFPGCTEEYCVPVLEAESGLKMGKDFKVCYSPERISPGEVSRSISSIAKVISACDDEALQTIRRLYSHVTKELFAASSIKVAEMAKLVENVQRDVNISLVNEFAMICDKLGIETHDVLDAASSKWNFQRFTPGLVGGHCISVDPYYLVYKSQQLGHTPRVILSGRDINDGIPGFVASTLLKKLLRYNKHLSDCRVLVMGITYKPNVDDIRNSKVVDLIRELESFSVAVDVIDPHASTDGVRDEYGITMSTTPQGKYDAILLAVPHVEYASLDESFYNDHLNGSRIVVDISGQLKNKFQNMDYWRL